MLPCQSTLENGMLFFVPRGLPLLGFVAALGRLVQSKTGGAKDALEPHLKHIIHACFFRDEVPCYKSASAHAVAIS